MTDFSLREKTVLLTGAAGILGARLTRHLLDAGAARVIALDRSEEALAKLGSELQNPAQLELEHADITSRAELDALKARVLGGDAVDVLINNAAAKSPNFFEPFASFPREDWDQVMDVNVTGAMHCCQVFGPDMAAAGRGSIINTLSIYGIVAPDQRIYEGSEYLGRAINTPAIYSVSKAALWGLTHYLSSYWGAQGVRVNAVTPGGIFSGQNDTFVNRYSARVPLNRMAQPDELMGAYLYLASDASSYVTGQNLVVDGGLTVW
ncbi:SDR family oxidoreductase [Bordetella genomosp. 1]|uniref:Short-chain dehydrogenase n=1 Tax=Bordetella genomosp. 1 TaxID=1395607 RepID=A0ABX4F3G2_9BORD|nr:SDR family oxidoreductase [Bordetella genomosp. 1]OZI68282.1 short-chain dehydrogenase [Bordetella genomosp. 1]